MRENFDALTDEQFRVKPTVELPVRGQLANREKPRKPQVRLETCDGGSHTILDAADWELLKRIGCHPGLDLSADAGQHFARRLDRFLEAASKVVRLASLGEGIRAYRDRTTG